MQQATRVVSGVSESRFSAPLRREVLSLEIVRDWLACHKWFVRGTSSSDSKMDGLTCLIGLSQ